MRRRPSGHSAPTSPVRNQPSAVRASSVTDISGALPENTPTGRYAVRRPSARTRTSPSTSMAAAGVFSPFFLAKPSPLAIMISTP